MVDSSFDDYDESGVTEIQKQLDYLYAKEMKQREDKLLEFEREGMQGDTSSNACLEESMLNTLSLADSEAANVQEKRICTYFVKEPKWIKRITTRCSKKRS